MQSNFDFYNLRTFQKSYFAAHSTCALLAGWLSMRTFIAELRDQHPSTIRFCMCCTSAFISETVTYPLDILKTRIQVYGELQGAKSHPGVFKLSRSVIKNEGFFQLWQGLFPALFRHMIYTGSRMPIYEFIRDKVFHLPPASEMTIKRSANLQENSHLSSNSNLNSSQSSAVLPCSKFGFAVRVAFTGVLAGAIAQFLASPTDLIKVRLQTERRWISEKHLSNSHNLLHPHPNISNQHLSFIRTSKQLIAEGGILGLWRGGVPNVQRAALVNMGELTTYDTAKRWFAVQFSLEDGPLLHTFASMTSGFVAAILGTPADLIKTRIMNQRSASTTQLSGPIYTGVIDCATKVVRNEGFMSLYKGFFLIWARMAPWSLTFWLTYEKIRSLIGITGF